MPSTLSNPGALLALCLVAVIVIGINATLLTSLRRSSHGVSAVRTWGQALRGALASQQPQDAQLDELHRAVSEFGAPPTVAKTPHE